MQSIKDRVAIVGMGCTKFGENWDMSPIDLMVDAAYEAYQDAGIDPKDIQAAWYGTFLSMMPGSGQPLAAALKLQYIPITRVENMCATGSDALRNAAYAVAAGVYDIALAVGMEKLKDSGYSGLPDSDMAMGTFGAPNTFRSRNFSSPGGFALMATGYFAKYGLNPQEGKEMLGRIAVKNHHNGALSPKAHFQKEVTLEQVLNAPIIAWPLGLFDCCGVSDGAAAAVICRADMAKKFRPDPVYIKALQIAVGPNEGFMDPSYDYSWVQETYEAGKKAYAEAGIKNPREEISTAEVHDCFSITEAVIYEDLQWAKRGTAKQEIEAGSFSLAGDLPVNTDGGLKCFGHPIGASGLRMMYEEYKQLQGKAGPRQVKDCKFGLTHNLGGIPGSATVSVLIVGL
ncbi:MAG: acetyl-CoA acetyltransferase [Dehalococcoidales bacterium]|nr:acetyl-CoA acetyltransferase [Dehalococcoidales bacterium]